MGNTASGQKLAKSAMKMSMHKKSKKQQAPRRNSHTSDSSSKGSAQPEDSSSNSAAAANGPVLREGGPVPQDACPELVAAFEWINSKDQHDLEKMRNMMDEDCFITFVDAEAEMPIKEYVEAFDAIFASFPNIRFHWKTMRVIDADDDECPAVLPSFQDECVMIMVDKYYGFGNHTGAPYSFGPYPPVEAQGTQVKDDGIQMMLWVSKTNQKIMKKEVRAFGNIVGPPGYYTKIGGLIM